ADGRAVPRDGRRQVRPRHLRLLRPHQRRRRLRRDPDHDRRDGGLPGRAHLAPRPRLGCAHLVPPVRRRLALTAPVTAASWGPPQEVFALVTPASLPPGAGTNRTLGIVNP